MIKAFTLVELLIVVAIIAILSAIAVPNFLEAQMRAKISRVHAEMRSLATALEGYVLDNGKYPYTRTFDPGRFRRLVPITTPVAYMSSIPKDILNREFPAVDIMTREPLNVYLYNTGLSNVGNGTANADTTANRLRWSLTSTGPWGRIEFPYYAFDDNFIIQNRDRYIIFIYDPTNGTLSRGQIYRRGGADTANTPGLIN